MSGGEPRRGPRCGSGGVLGTERGQALSEYVVMMGFVVATVIAAMAVFVGPVAAAVVRLARWIVVGFTS
jgi:hypothetical protein